MSNTPYNGWTNYETWCVHMHLSTSLRIQDAVGNIGLISREPGDVQGEIIDSLAELVKREHMERMPAHVGRVWTDLLTHSLGAVDWHEIATRLLEE